MLALKKPIWSKYPYGPARTRPYEYTHTVGPYAYGRTVRVYSYGPYVWSDRASILMRSVRTRTVQIHVWSGTFLFQHV